MHLKASLVLLAPRIGGASETFIQRHIDHLAPADQTLVIAREEVPDPTWTPMPEVRYIGGRRWVPHGSIRWRVAARLNRRRRSLGPRAPTANARLALERALGESNASTGILAEYLDVWATLLLDAELGDRPLVVRAHGYDVSERVTSSMWRDAYKQLADRAVIAPVSYYSRSILLSAGLPEPRVVCVPNGVDLVRFQPRPQTSVRATGRLRLLSVGRLVEKKDPRATIEALRLVRAGGLDATITIVGEGPLRGAIDARVRALGLADSVVLRGAVTHEEVVDLLGHADVFVQHSQRASNGDEEGMPMSVLEAMASGLPVVATRHAGITEVLSGGAGELIDEGDHQAMARALLELGSDPDLRLALGRRARSRVEEKYSWEVECRGLRELLGLR